ncbi:MAG: D-alanyl-D-alanine carboxypeptidase/D-alanyl-D-alanine-endopeptidase [Ignavibacteriota bacterium]
MILRILLFTAILFINSFSQSLKTKIDNVIKDKFFDRCLIAIQVEDLTTNKTLFKKNEKMLLHPASNMKIITTTTGLIYLGPDYKFKTDLYYDGYVSNDTLNGNLYFVGGCDPDFVTQDFYGFVDAIKLLKISVVNGNIYGDVSFKDSLYWGKGWMWDDDPSSDAPHLSALNLNDNCVEVVVQQSDYLDQPTVSLNPNTKYVSVKNEITNDSTEKFEITRNWLEEKNEIIVKGKYPKSIKYTSEFVNVLESAKYFLTVFSEVLDSNNIKVIGNIGIEKHPAQIILLNSFNRKYSDIINNLNKTSDNLSAEMILLALAEKFYGKPANAKNGINVIDSMIQLIEMNSDDYRIVDGSGVSHYNVVTAELLSSILKYFYEERPELYTILYNSFPIAGVDGTLENRMRNTPAENNVHAKTGTITGVSTLSGYMTTKKDHTLAFSIMIQNYVGSSSKAKEFQDQICKILAELK